MNRKDPYWTDRAKRYATYPRGTAPPKQTPPTRVDSPVHTRTRPAPTRIALIAPRNIAPITGPLVITGPGHQLNHQLGCCSSGFSCSGNALEMCRTGIKTASSEPSRVWTSHRFRSSPWPMPNCKGHGGPQSRGQNNKRSPRMDGFPRWAKVAHGFVRHRIVLARCALNRSFERDCQKNDDPRHKKDQSWHVGEE
jgi:hypothetical protein